MNTAALEQLAADISKHTGRLKNAGWDRVIATHLAKSLANVIDKSEGTDWFEVSSRAKALVSVLADFFQDAPAPERLASALQSAHNLAALLREGPLSGQVDAKNLPPQPGAWVFCLLGDQSAETIRLSRTLQSLGFIVEHKSDGDFSEGYLCQEQLVLVAGSSWLTQHGQWLLGQLKQSTGQEVMPILVGMLDSLGSHDPVFVSGLGVRLFFEPPVDASKLLSELAGVAWMPQAPYRVLLLSADRQKLALGLSVLHDAGIEVVTQSEPLQMPHLLATFPPDALILDASLALCQSPGFLALCRLKMDSVQLPVIYWLGPDCPDEIRRHYLATGSCYLSEPVQGYELLSLVIAKSRQHRLLQGRAKGWQAVQAQQKWLRSTLDAHSIVSIASAHGTIIDVNQKFCDISGYSKEELIGHNHRIVKSGHHPHAFFVEMWKTISAGKTWQGEIQNRSKDGKPYWVQSTIAPIMDGHGKPKQYFSVRTDVTQQKQLHAEERRQQRLLNLLRETLQQFNVDRNLGNAVNRLLDGVLLLTESAFGFVAEVLYEPIGHPYLSIKAVTDISWDETSRAMYQKMQATGAGFKSLDSLYGAVILAGRPLISNDPQNDPRSRGLPTGHPPLTAFMGMPIYSGDCLLGMLGLANKQDGYDAGSVEFLAPFTETCANLIETAGKNDRQQQAVDDLAEFLEKAEKNRARQSELVASVSYELRTSLNGFLGEAQLLSMQTNLAADVLECAQEIIKSSDRFNQLIDKLARAHEENPLEIKDSAALIAPTDGESEQQKQAYRILVAEDNPTNQTLLKMQLGVLGIDAVIVADGSEALVEWKKGGYDLILSDISMPRMDGMQLARSIRAAEQGTEAHMPMIAITAFTYPEELEACLNAGMDDTLPKPIDLNYLRQKLQQWLPEQAVAASKPPLSVFPSKLAQSPYGKHVLDTDYLLKITGGLDARQIQSLVDLFTSSAQAELVLCRRDLLAQDMAGLALSMHKLKSSSQAIGALRFAELAKELEIVAKQGAVGHAAALLRELEHALTDVEEAIVKNSLPALQNTKPCLELPNCVLVVDDDAVVRRQTSLLLTALGVTEVLVADSGMAGLKELEAHGQRVNLLLCDLNMPEMDGIEFLRRMSEIGYQGNIILVSGVDARLMQSAVELACLQGLHLVGSLGKPLVRDDFLALLNDASHRQVNTVKKATAKAIKTEDILDGLNNDEFDVFFQPKVDAFTLKPVGVEALARWRRQGAAVPAEAFILAAEHCGLVGALSEVLLVKAFIGGRRLVDAGFPLDISVNLSAAWMSDVNLPDFIQASTETTGLKVGNVILEVTETGVMDDLTKTLDIMTRLRLKGFKLSIDDFGTGYSSLEQLQRIPFNELKLDRAFVKGAADNATARTILSASVGMAAKLNLVTVAEGVETQEDLDLVRGVGCDFVQGWLIAKAMPVDELIAWLQADSAK